MNILSIQSWVVYGHVGNAAAAFPLQRLGAEVWAVNTVQFSNHTGYGNWTGEVATGAQIAALVEGVAARGVLSQCDAVLSGYMGDQAIGSAILDAVERVRAANPRAVYCCDPVIGDAEGGVYVRPGIPEFMRAEALPQADIATPNQFELQHLTGLPCGTLDQVKRAVADLQTALRRDGPRCVLTSGLATDTTPADAIDLLVCEGSSSHLLRTPRLDLAINGAGDMLAALFLFHRLATGSAVAALEAAAAAVHGVLRRTADAGARELLTVAAQEELVCPSLRFRAVPC
ncbi:MAG: pyridoxal kinase PdxY [Alphaproteobacteria bacterium]|nr:pyridoxal kinase PdxY [Alphaproteobacteria bacterium]